MLPRLLKRTPEWDSPDARDAAALVCDASGRVVLARILRGSDASMMCKRDMLFLACIWGYKCDIWQLIAIGRGIPGGGIGMAERVVAAEARLAQRLAAAPSGVEVDGEDAAGAAGGPGACAATVIWRCLDPTHGPDCARCVHRGCGARRERAACRISLDACPVLT